MHNADWFPRDLDYCKYFRQSDDRSAAIRTQSANSAICVYFQVVYSSQRPHTFGIWSARAAHYSCVLFCWVNKANAITHNFAQKRIICLFVSVCLNSFGDINWLKDFVFRLSMFGQQTSRQHSVQCSAVLYIVLSPNAHKPTLKITANTFPNRARKYIVTDGGAV